jgi:hypothetical protein
MKRIIRLTESDLARIVKRVINEQDPTGNHYGLESRPLSSIMSPKKPNPNNYVNNATYTGSKEGDIKYFQLRKSGDQGPAGAIQNLIGMDGADGLGGPITTKCLKFYQKMNGLPVDGIVGPQTAEALWNTSKSGKSFLITFKPKNAEEQKMKQYCQSVQMSSQTGSSY